MYVGDYSGSYNGWKEYNKGNEGQTDKEESWEEKLQKFDEQIQQIKEENEREQEQLKEAREERERIYRKMSEKQLYRKYLARQDEISQLNEKISLERAVGEDVYIEKPPLSTSPGVAEILALCAE